MKFEFNKLSKLEIDNIFPKGWVYNFLNNQKKGLTGNIHVAGYPYNTDMWAAEAIKKHNGESWFAWWPYEQTSYFLDGALRLGKLLKDEEVSNVAIKNMQYVLDHFDYNTNRISTKLQEYLWRWPYAAFNRMFTVIDESELTGDYIDLLTKHYLTFSPEDFA